MLDRRPTVTIHPRQQPPRETRSVTTLLSNLLLYCINLLWSSLPGLSHGVVVKQLKLPLNPRKDALIELICLPNEIVRGMIR